VSTTAGQRQEVPWKKGGKSNGQKEGGWRDPLEKEKLPWVRERSSNEGRAFEERKGI